MIKSNTIEETGFVHDLEAGREPLALENPAIPYRFLPVEPETLKDTGLSLGEVEALVLKLLFSYGAKCGKEIARHLHLPFRMTNEILINLKRQLFVGHKNSAEMGDYEYVLAENGVDRAKRLMEHCSFCGSAPVSLEDYVAAVKQQTVRRNKVDFATIEAALAELVVSKSSLAQVGQAVSSGRCLFLYGPPGNGKTSIATRLIRAISDTIWIPRTLSACGEIIRLFDPNVHEVVEHSKGNSLINSPKVDERWVRIKRPCVVVGGELNIESLEATQNTVTGILESPIHFKSNGGCLVVDDFGRQRISSTELLNRWIVPLERGMDYITLPSGRHIEIPFDQLLVFSTNLQPSELCDEAFLRRIPYKVEVKNPTRQQFHALFALRAKQLGFDYSEQLVDGLLDRHFTAQNRPLRFCHAEDILNQVTEFCHFHRLPLKLNAEMLDYAALNYFVGSA